MLSDAERATLGEIGHRLGRQDWQSALRCQQNAPVSLGEELALQLL
jgi:hypothetical protein